MKIIIIALGVIEILYGISSLFQGLGLFAFIQDLKGSGANTTTFTSFWFREHWFLLAIFIHASLPMVIGFGLIRFRRWALWGEIFQNLYRFFLYSFGFFQLIQQMRSFGIIWWACLIILLGIPVLILILLARRNCQAFFHPDKISKFIFCTFLFLFLFLTHFQYNLMKENQRFVNSIISNLFF